MLPRRPLVALGAAALLSSFTSAQQSTRSELEPETVWWDTLTEAGKLTGGRLELLSPPRAA